MHAAVVVEQDSDFYTKPWLDDLKRSTFPEERYNYAFLLVGQLVQDLQRNQKLQDHWSEFLTFMENKTAIAEACDISRAEHLVQYQKAQMFWLGWKMPDACGFLSESPVSMRQKFIEFGFDVPKEMIDIPVTIYDDDDDGKHKHNTLLESTRQYFQTAENSEGAVVYVVLSNGSVASMFKEKNFDYIRRRAVREQVKKGATSFQLRDRIESLHVPYTSEFLQTSLELNAWVQMQIQSGLTTLRNIDQSFMTVEQSFSAISQADRDRALIDWNSNVKSKKIIIVVGAPCQGSGKTRFSIVITHVLNQLLSKSCGLTTENHQLSDGIGEIGENDILVKEDVKSQKNHKPAVLRVCRISQDDCQGQRKLFLQTVEKKVNDPNIHIVVIDKYNNQQNRRDYQAFGFCTKIFVGFIHPQDEEDEIDDAGYGRDLLPVRRFNLINHCMKKIQSRKDGHRSLRHMDMSEDGFRSLLG